MKLFIVKKNIIMIIVMIIIGILFNPMNILAYRFSDLFISLTLFYGSLLMASNMLWAHEVIKFFSIGNFNLLVFSIGIFFSILISIFLLRNQTFVDDKEWLKRMISHHSTALTTSYKILKTSKNSNIKKLAEKIIVTQENEIKLMKSLL